MTKKKTDEVPVMEVMTAKAAEDPVVEAPVEEVAPEKPAPRFTKKQLVGSKKFADRKDVLGALLKKDQTYTIAECEKLIEEFMKGKV